MIIIALGMLSESVEAHDWYPDNCCHGGDCQHAQPGMVEATDKGYLVRKGIVNPRGSVLLRDTLVPYGDPRIKFFPPEAYHPKWNGSPSGMHVCTYPEGVRCIYTDVGI